NNAYTNFPSILIYFYYSFFFNVTTITKFYTLSLHDALPISTVSRMQSSRVVRGSTRSWRSLPLMRSVIGTAPSMFGPSAIAAGETLCPGVLSRCAGPHPAMTAAAAPPPVFRRNARRDGFDGLEGGSFRIAPPSVAATASYFIPELDSANSHRKKVTHGEDDA